MSTISPPLTLYFALRTHNICFHLQLKALAKQVGQRATQLARPSGGSKTRADLTDPSKWAMGDLTQFSQILKAAEKELAGWRTEKVARIEQMKDLENEMLKGESSLLSQRIV